MQNNALGLVNAWRAIAFTWLKIFVDNVFHSLKPVFYVLIGHLLVFFGIVQLIACAVIFHIFDETKNKTKKEKMILTNPKKMEIFNLKN